MADPDPGDITAVTSAAAILAQESSNPGYEVYETRDVSSATYRGPSLGLAYLLALISRSRRLRLDSVSASRDLWATGTIRIEGNQPFLQAVARNEFKLKLEAFLEASNRDTVFIVPVPNYDTPESRTLCREHHVRVLSLSEFRVLISSPQELFKQKTIIKIHGHELVPLVQELFGTEDHTPEPSRYPYPDFVGREGLLVSGRPSMSAAVGGGQVRLIEREVAALDLPDILTPGLSLQALVSALAPHMGSQLAHRLGALSEEAISAVENSDFALHVPIGKQIEADACGFREVEAAGRYFAAEGYRLLVDIESDSARKDALLQSAIEHYSLSLESWPKNPRALRGLARVKEVQQHFDEAMALLEQARGIAWTELAIVPQSKRQLYLSHEILRITRHRIHCILDIQATNPLSQWHRESMKRQLEGEIFESDNLHRQKMPLFDGRKRWSYIEWFMGHVFLAKAWGNSGDPLRMVLSLLQALWFRRQLLDDARSLTKVEQENLRWWLRVASSEAAMATSHCFKGFDSGIERLAQALDSGRTDDVLQQIDDLVLPIAPLWRSDPSFKP